MPHDATPKTSRVRAARQRARLTQAQAAVRAGIAITTLALAERFGACSRLTAEKLAPVLGCRPEDLLDPETQRGAVGVH